MQADRTKVVKVIRDWSESLGRQNEASPPSSSRRRGFEQEALEHALKEHGMALEAYREALHADPTLADLERMSITEALAGRADPGPYDAISRESPSGQPGDLKKSRSDGEL